MSMLLKVSKMKNYILVAQIIFVEDLKNIIGLNFSTKRYKPWKCIYYESCLHQEDAKRREKYFKTSQGQRLLKRRLKNIFMKRGQEKFNKFEISLRGKAGRENYENIRSCDVLRLD